MSRAPRSFDRAALRRASLSELAALAEELASAPRPADALVARQRAKHLAAVRDEIVVRATTGKPSENPHKGKAGRHPSGSLDSLLPESDHRP